MTDEDFHKKWYQVRLFTKHFIPEFYADLLGRVVLPLVSAKPTAPLFFSRYACPLGMDDGDTDIASLPAGYLLPQGQPPWHLSIRIRFREMRGVRNTLEALMNAEPNFWFSDIRACKLAGVLPADRFSTQQIEPAKSRRIRKVAELLHANCRTVLDTLIIQAGNWSFEANNHAENQPLGTVSQSINHMVVNAWSLPNSQPLPIFLQMGNNQFARL